MKNNIYPCLWFDGQAKEAAKLYLDVFGNSRILDENPIVVTIEMHGQKFMLLNGGPMYQPNPSISFMVICETKEEVDDAWNKLIEGGTSMMPLDTYPWSERYGWVQDRFGISWQLYKGKLEDTGGQKFCPTLMYTHESCGKAEEAIGLYTSLFPDSSVAGILRYSAEDDDTEGLVKHAQFKLDGFVLMAMDSSYDHPFRFSEGISIAVDCNTQEEIDHFWEKLTADGGEESMCGWLKDKYGVSWQIVPAVLPKLMADPEKGQKVIDAFMKMRKFEIATLLAV
jgi:predicted 3-demethylubiquinone-9 3-methyltransferase (glyoxalase superfamily)